MKENSVDSVVCDPPYHLTGKSSGGSGDAGFMGKKWDGGGIAFSADLWRLVLRVLRPGGHLIAFGGERTVHRLTCAVEDAGFEVRGQGCWVSAQSFPKSLDIGKAIDKLAGAVRKPGVLVPSGGGDNYDAWRAGEGREDRTQRHKSGMKELTQPATPEAQQWSGYGTALKTMEPWVLARKPLSEKTVAQNVLRWGTGALTIEGCRLPFAGTEDQQEAVLKNQHEQFGSGPRSDSNQLYSEHDAPRASWAPPGRWPATVMVADLDVEGPVLGTAVLGGAGTQSGNTPANDNSSRHVLSDGGLVNRTTAGVQVPTDDGSLDGPLGPYTRHFRIPGTDGRHDEALLCLPPDLLARLLPTLVVCPKAGTRERDAGVLKQDGQRRGNLHTTVKPIALMRHLVRLVTRPNGVVLDPFCGSGSTGVAALWEGLRFIGIEQQDTAEEPYCTIARQRLLYAHTTPAPAIKARKPKKAE